MGGRPLQHTSGSSTVQQVGQGRLCSIVPEATSIRAAVLQAPMQSPLMHTALMHTVTVNLQVLSYML